MQRPHSDLKALKQGLLRLLFRFDIVIFLAEQVLYTFQVDIAETVKPEPMEFLGRLAELKVVDARIDLLNSLV